MEDVKAGSNKAADGEDTPPAMGVCELAGDLERPVYLIKNESQGNKGPTPHPLPSLPMPVLHPLCSSEVGRCGLSPEGGSLGRRPGLPPPPRAAPKRPASVMQQ